MSEYIPSHSARAAWKQCNRRYFYEYIERLELDADTGPALRMGRAFASTLEHRSLEQVAASYAEYDITPKMEEEMVQVEELARGYFKQYTEWEPGTEREVEFNSPLLGRGYLDGVIKVGDRRWAIEDKTASRYHWNEAAERTLAYEHQTTAYFGAMQEAGTPIDKMVRRITFKPTINQRLKKNPETLEQYRARLAADIAAEPLKYYRCYDLYRTQEQIDEFLDGVAITIAQIDASEHAAEVIGMSAYPQNTAACASFGGCAFQSLCKDGELALPKYRVKAKSDRQSSEEPA
jgi:hypothetical protein